MSVLIKISFQHDDELALILDRLEDLKLSVTSKEYQNPNGQFRRVYLKSHGRLTKNDKTEQNA